VLDIAQKCSSQDLRIVKLHKEEFSFCKPRPIKRKVQSIESRILQILN